MSYTVSSLPHHMCDCSSLLHNPLLLQVVVRWYSSAITAESRILLGGDPATPSDFVELWRELGAAIRSSPPRPRSTCTRQRGMQSPSLSDPTLFPRSTFLACACAVYVWGGIAVRWPRSISNL